MAEKSYEMTVAGKDIRYDSHYRDIPDKPPYSYVALIHMAISNSPTKQLTLNEIYRYITEKFLYYRNSPGGSWQNSIRHNLSLHNCFQKIAVKDGRCHYWALDPCNPVEYEEGNYRRKKRVMRSRAARLAAGHVTAHGQIPTPYCPQNYYPVYPTQNYPPPLLQQNSQNYPPLPPTSTPTTMCPLPAFFLSNGWMGYK